MKSYLKFVSVCGVVLILWACGSANRTTYTPEEIDTFKSFIDNKSYEFVAATASPIPSTGMTAIANSGMLPPGSTAANIQLQGNYNYVKVAGDSISAYLPYYGERQSGGGYNSDAGIIFNDVPSSYKENFDPDKNEMKIIFTISEGVETYRVTMNIFPNNKTTVIVTSTQRFAIRYLGEIKPVEETTEMSK